MTNAKAYTIITPDGNPDSMKIISEGNWNGEIVFSSRERYLTPGAKPATNNNSSDQGCIF